MLANFFRARRLLENAPAVSAGQDDSAFEEDPALSPVAPSRYLSGRVLDIARASVQLAELGPQLALFAAELEGQAQTQAARAASIAQTMAALTQNLDQAVSALRASSEQVGETLAVVERIAMQTRILSVNASIEAARAGEQGRSFGVVVEEVQRLADRTGGSTHEIETCVREMQTRIAQVEAVAGLRAVEGSMATSCNVGAVQREVEGLNASAGDQLQSARVLHSMGVHVNALTESLLLSVGAFRFEAHQRAERILRELVDALILLFKRLRQCHIVDDQQILIVAAGRVLAEVERAHHHRAPIDDKHLVVQHVRVAVLQHIEPRFLEHRHFAVRRLGAGALEHA